MAGSETPAGLMTKHLDSKTMATMLVRMGLVKLEGRSALAQSLTKDVASCGVSRPRDVLEVDVCECASLDFIECQSSCEHCGVSIDSVEGVDPQHVVKDIAFQHHPAERSRELIPMRWAPSPGTLSFQDMSGFADVCNVNVEFDVGDMCAGYELCCGMLCFAGCLSPETFDGICEESQRQVNDVENPTECESEFTASVIADAIDLFDIVGGYRC